MNEERKIKKAVITILGIIGANWNKELKQYEVKEGFNKALYKSAILDIEDKNYTNTLPLLIDKYSKEYNIIPLFTDDSKFIQQKVLKVLEKDTLAKLTTNIFKEEYMIKDENNFSEVFSQVDTIINSNDEVIIDVTHGFRHLPLLMLIDLMITNFNNTNKIKKILFAKEIKKNKEYEFIDLIDYMDLANLNYVLTSFDKNYTTAKIKTSNEEYNKFLDLLEQFSSNILANSLDALIGTKSNNNEYQSITDKLLTQINLILENDNSLLNNFKQNILTLKEHIQEIKNYNTKIDYEKLYLFSKNMNSKGYLLNSITLLSEAIGLYCKEKLKTINPKISSFINEYENKVTRMKNSENKKYQLYPLSNQSKTIYKKGKDFNGDYLAIKNPNSKEKTFNDTSKKITETIKNYISNLEDSSKYQNLKDMIILIDVLRNNLAHGNSSKRLKDVKNDIDMLLKQFENEIKNFQSQLKEIEVPKKEICISKFNTSKTITKDKKEKLKKAMDRDYKVPTNDKLNSLLNKYAKKY